MTGGLICEEQWGFREGKGCVDQISTLKHVGERARDKKCSVCRFYRFGEGIIGKLVASFENV